jgi:Domain of unknown function (DUF1707)
MATQPSLRIGDRERDAVATELQEHFAHGRLSLEEFKQRLDAVFAAKTQDDLSRITSDLPHVRSAGAPLPSSRSGSAPRLISGPPADGGSGRGGMAAGWPGASWAGEWSEPGWPGPGWSGSDWSGRGRRRPRGGLAVLISLMAALASWLLVYDVLLVGLRFPWAGRVGLLIAIFAMIRGLLRRIFRGPCRRRMTGARYSGRPW